MWLNSRPLTLRQLRGSVVLIDFWDFTCVNCIRTLPYIKEWHHRYGPLGLQVIGIHSPEFYFGRAPEILELGLKEFGIDYPVMLDNDYAVWKSFANKYWPSKYLIDTGGYLRFYHAGEGAYADTEAAIQELLRETDPSLAFPPPMPDTAVNMALCPRPTPELYLGHRRGRIANACGFVEDKEHDYELGAGPQEDLVELAGRWLSMPDCLQSAASGARMVLPYSGSEVNLVLAGTGAVTIRENGETLGTMRVDRPRMYQIVQRNRFAEGLLDLTFDGAGLRAFAFTFGSCP